MYPSQLSVDNMLQRLSLSKAITPLGLGVINEARGCVAGLVTVYRKRLSLDGYEPFELKGCVMHLSSFDLFLEIDRECRGIILVESNVSLIILFTHHRLRLWHWQVISKYGLSMP
jgi:hypothetical protein